MHFRRFESSTFIRLQPPAPPVLREHPKSLLQTGYEWLWIQTEMHAHVALSRVSPRVKLLEGRRELVSVSDDCPGRVSYAKQSTAAGLHFFHFCQRLLTLCFCQSCACIAPPRPSDMRVVACRCGATSKILQSKIV